MNVKNLLILFLFIISRTANANVTLPAIFTDHMVLQRDKPIVVWGWAESGETITVILDGVTVTAKTDRHGDWSVELPAKQAGGPFDMIVRGSNELVLKDVLLGDIWICGGQSNMQLSIQETNYSETDTAFIRQSRVRFFTVNFGMDYFPQKDVSSDGWHRLDQDHINAFSAVGYQFGKYVQKEIGVPIGLISDNLGATAVETWMSNKSLMKFPQFHDVMAPVLEEGKNFEELQNDFNKMKEKWSSKYYYKGPGVDAKWYLPAISTGDWKELEASGNTWENVADLKDFDGAVWFRKTFDLPDGYDQEKFRIGLSQIDDYDITWVNGEKIGETYGDHNHRNYYVETAKLKKKGNVLVVRVFDTGGTGGFTTATFWGNPVLWGTWKYKKGLQIDPDKFPKPMVPNATPFSSPSVLFNANIAPLTLFPIEGVIWYQGESNEARAYEYRELFPALITDWRDQWKQGDFPFLFVQLANYQPETKQPEESHWAELREAQAMALSLPNTGMATAIDLGEAGNIHPKNKEDVGKRLGLAAMKIAYNQDVIDSGPVFDHMDIKGDRAIIQFTSVGKGLVSHDKFGYLRGFQISGNDEKWHWAKAGIHDNQVWVSSDQVNEPVAVRYAWSDNPGPLDLYNKAGLPALPFRTDDWKGATYGQKFVEGPRF